MRSRVRAALVWVAAVVVTATLVASGQTAASAAPTQPVAAESGVDAAQDSRPGGASRAAQYGFGTGTSLTTTDARAGTVLGAAAVPSDQTASNGHFVYYPLPTKTVTTTYSTGRAETLSLSGYMDSGTGPYGLAIDSRGKVFSWGGNYYGQLGDGGVTGSQGGMNSRAAPGLVTTLPSDLTFVQVSAGHKHALALSSAGDIYAWGSRNESGQLGQGNRNVIAGGQSSALKVNVPGVKFTQISASVDFSLALATDGTVYSWGSGSGNASGQGLATKDTPTKVQGLSGIAQISAGGQHSGALTAAGDLYMWGSQASGALGDGIAGQGTAAPKRIGSLKWKQIVPTDATTFGISTAGVLYAWGDNLYGQLGFGDYTSRSVPTATSLTNVTSAAGSINTSAVTTASGAIYAAGTATSIGLLAANALSWTLIVPAGSGASEVHIGSNAGAYVSTNPALPTRTWGSGAQTGRGTGKYPTPGPLDGVDGSPALTEVIQSSTTTPTLTDAQATASRIVFGDPTKATGPTTGWQAAKNLQVITDGGTKYLRGDVPPHESGAADVYLQWNDGTNTWQNTGTYTYTVALALETKPRPAATAETVAVTVGFVDAREASYAGSAVVDFSIPALVGDPAPLVAGAGSTLTGVPFTGETAVTRVGLRPGQLPNNGPNGWHYYTSATARAGSVAVNRGEMLSAIEFQSPAEVGIHLWSSVAAPGGAAPGGEIGTTGTAWAVHPDSAVTPGTPDLTQSVAAFAVESAHPDPIAADRKQGWFAASVAPGSYWLVQTKASAGRQLLAQPVRFTVAASGAVTLGAGASALVRVGDDWDSGGTANTIVVRSPAALVLPMAGSEPWGWLPLTGIGFLAVGALLILRLRFAATR